MEDQITSRRTKILYIEDDRPMLDLVRLILKNSPYEFYGAQNGTEGLDLIQSVKPDLVLLDLMMPDIDGWGVYQRMKADESAADIPVIVVTAKDTPIDETLARYIAKVQDYVTKPFTPQELLDSIAKVLSGVETDQSGAA